MIAHRHPGQDAAGVARVALRINEAAHALGVSRSTLYKLIRVGKLGYCRLAGGSIRVPIRELDAYLARALVAGTPR